MANDFIRDFHIDYTLLLENLMDPDHGLFAHQVPLRAGGGSWPSGGPP